MSICAHDTQLQLDLNVNDLKHAQKWRNIIGVRSFLKQTLDYLIHS